MLAKIDRSSLFQTFKKELMEYTHTSRHCLPISRTTNFPEKMAPDQRIWIIEGQALLRSYDLAPPPSPVTKLNLRHTGRGGGVVEEPNHTTEWTILSVQDHEENKLGHVDVVIKRLTWQIAVERDRGGKSYATLNYWPIFQKIGVITFHDDVDANLFLFYFLHRVAWRGRR